MLIIFINKAVNFINVCFRILIYLFNELYFIILFYSDHRKGEYINTSLMDLVRPQ